ncbi:MAG: metallophosphoesterase [Gallionellaceae bacterium]
MRIHILSDIHLEFAEFENHTVDCDVIVLAGDIQLGAEGIEWARQRWPGNEIIYIPGNHEYYRSQYEQANVQLAEAGRLHGVHVLNRAEVIIDGVRFLGATLWTDFNLFGEALKPGAMRACSRYLADFRLIRFGDRIFTPEDAAHLHDLDVAWLESQLNKTFEGKTVVVTHYLPSRQSVAARYAKDIVSAGFASELPHLLGISELWIHGHTHDSFDYVEAGTRVVCNPRGYVTGRKTQENAQFNPVLVVDI